MGLAPSSEILSMLELLVPQILRENNPEWAQESIDGFYLSTSVKVTEANACLTGTCILISDQTVTPFLLEIGLTEGKSLGAVRVRLGEQGGGALGISGPSCNSREAYELLWSLPTRLSSVDWQYDETWANTVR